MKSMIRRVATFAALSTAVGTLIIVPSLAGQFEQHEVDQTKFVAIASPFRGGQAHQLLVVEQVSSSRPCWSETGNAPTLVDPLLTTFDFTGICGRSTDSNGYSIRVNGEDLGLQYSVRVIERNGDMLLVGAPRDRTKPSLLIGRTNGMTTGFAKINLEPGWRFTKREFGGKELGHVYLTFEGGSPPVVPEDSSVATATSSSTIVPSPTAPSAPSASRFQDTVNDIYVAEINQAVQIGFISGFEDNTFRPQEPLTREQLVSMVLGALDSLPHVKLKIPRSVSTQTFSDVEISRWSATKIQFAQEKHIVSGYKDGTFRPDQPVTRAELMAVLRRAAEYGKTLQNEDPQLQGNRPATSFSDIENHWANALISQMSTYCQVASPLNESGTDFAPDAAAQRNYATAATLRMLNCTSGRSIASH